MSDKHHIDGVDVSGKVMETTLVYRAGCAGEVTLKLVPMTVDWESDQGDITIEELTKD